MNVYTSICARAADEAAFLLRLNDDGRSQVMLAHDLPALHGHHANGVCVREFIPIERTGVSRLSDAWTLCGQRGREASRY